MSNRSKQQVHIIPTKEEKVERGLERSIAICAFLSICTSAIILISAVIGFVYVFSGNSKRLTEVAFLMALTLGFESSVERIMTDREIKLERFLRKKGE